ncbi:MAG: glutathione peroxidase [Saprospiraceae bacterium]|nr:glutathione peroxidase [Saprospiraceae bacterium]
MNNLICLFSLLIFFNYTMTAQDLYHIPVNDLSGQAMNLESFRGKKILIVNVASECGYTPQYGQLQELYEAYENKLVILGCPSNDFGGQEPGSNETIGQFCKKNYGVTFPLTEKLGILQQTHPLYQWLTKKEKNGLTDNEVKWNFHKFLINEDGSLYKSLPSSVNPMDDSIISWITK